jgi:hypothetical protein
LTGARPTLAAGVFLLLLARPGAPLAAPADSDCLACHTPDLARADGRPLGQDLGGFAGSVHGQAGLSCVDCHADLAAVEEFPHAEDLAPAQCASCHAEAVEMHAASVHARPGASGAACADCHGAHEILPAKDAASRTYHLTLPQTCGRCHADETKMGTRAAVPALFADSIHGQALSRRGLVVAPNCATCHGSHAVHRAADAESPVHHARVAATCGNCHQGIRTEYDGSVHAAAVRDGKPGAACSDCHSAHGIKETLPAWRLEVARECGSCHEESIRTYRDGFHGQASTLGYTRVATCADCHGAHGILPDEDPRSRVAAANRVATCARCHPGANARFAAFDPHADPHDQTRSRPVYYTALFMKVLLAGVFAFFGIHTALWFPRSWKERRRHRGGPDAGREEARAEDDKA